MADTPLSYSIEVRYDSKKELDDFRRDLSKANEAVAEFRGELKKIQGLRADPSTQGASKSIDLRSIRDATKALRQQRIEAEKAAAAELKIQSALKKNKEANGGSLKNSKGKFASETQIRAEIAAQEASARAQRATTAAQIQNRAALDGIRDAANKARAATKDFTEGTGEATRTALAEEKALSAVQEELLRVQAAIEKGDSLVGEDNLFELQAIEKSLKKQLALRVALAQARQNSAEGLLTDGTSPQQVERLGALQALDKVRKEAARTEARTQELAKSGLKLTKEQRLAYGGLTDAAKALLKQEIRLDQAQANVGDEGLRQTKSRAVATEELSKALDRQAISEERLRQGLNVDGRLEADERKLSAAKAIERVQRDRAKAEEFLAAAAKANIVATDKERLAVGGLAGQEERLLRAKEAKRKETERQGNKAAAVLDAETRALKEQNDARAKALLLQARRRLEPAARIDPNPIKRFLKSLTQVNIGLKKSERNVKRLNRQLSLTGGFAGRLAFTFRRLFGVLAAFTAVRLAVRGFIDLVKAGVKFNATLEQTVLGIGALITAVANVEDPILGAVSAADQLTLAQAEGTRQTKQLRLEALKTAATFEELQNAFQTAIAPGLIAGLDVDEIRKISVRISQAASAIGLPQQQLAEEIRSLLQGTITARNTRIATSLGITNEDIENAKEAGELAEFLDRRFAAFGIAAGKALETFAAKITNARDAIVQLVAAGSTGFFQDLKNALQAITDAIADTSGDVVIIRPEAIRAAEAIGDALAFALDQAVRVSRELGFDTAEGAAKALAQSIKFIALAAAGITQGVAKGLGLLSSVVSKIAKTVQGLQIFGDEDETNDALRTIASGMAQIALASVAIFVSFHTVTKLWRASGILIRNIGKSGTFLFNEVALLPTRMGLFVLRIKQATAATIAFSKSASLALASFTRAHPVLLAIVAAMAVVAFFAKQAADEAAGFELSWSEALSTILSKTNELGFALFALVAAGAASVVNLVLAGLLVGIKGIIFIIQETIGKLATGVAGLFGVGEGAASALNAQIDAADKFVDSLIEANREKQRGVALDLQSILLANKKRSAADREVTLREAQRRNEGIEFGEEDGASKAAEAVTEYQKVLDALRPIISRVTEGQGELADQFKALEEAAKDTADAIRVAFAQEGLTGSAREQAGSSAEARNEATRASFKLVRDLAAEETKLEGNRSRVRDAQRQFDATTLRDINRIVERRREVAKIQESLFDLVAERGDEPVGQNKQGDELSLRKVLELEIVPVASSKAERELLAIATRYQNLIAQNEQQNSSDIALAGLGGSGTGPGPSPVQIAEVVQSFAEAEAGQRKVREITREILDLETATRLVRSEATIPAILADTERADRVIEELIVRNSEEAELLGIQTERVALEQILNSSGSTRTAQERLEVLRLERTEQLTLADIEKDRLTRNVGVKREQREANLNDLREQIKITEDLALSESASQDERDGAESTVRLNRERLTALLLESALLTEKETQEIAAQETAYQRIVALFLKKFSVGEQALAQERLRTQELRIQAGLLQAQQQAQAISAASGAAQFNVSNSRRLTDSQKEFELLKITTAETALLLGLEKERAEKIEERRSAALEAAADDASRDQINSSFDQDIAANTQAQIGLNEQLRQQSFLLEEARRKVEEPFTFGARVALDNFIAESTDAFTGMVGVMTDLLNGFSETSGRLLTDAIAGTGNSAKTKEAFGKLLQGLAVQFNTILIKFIVGKFLSLIPKLKTPDTAGTVLIQAAVLWKPVAAELLQAALTLLAANAAGAGGGGFGVTGGQIGPPLPGAVWTGGRAGAVSSSKARSAMHSIAGMSVASGGRLANPFSSARGYALGGSLRPTTPSASSGTAAIARASRPKGIHPNDRIPIWAAQDEWVIQSKSALKYGQRVMRLINEGKIDPEDLRALAFGIPLTGRPVKAQELGFNSGGRVGGGTQRSGQSSGGGGDGGPPVGFIVMDDQEWDQLIAGGSPALDTYLESRRQFLKGLVS
jgi:hypothetical protein